MDQTILDQDRVIRALAIDRVPQLSMRFKDRKIGLVAVVKDVRTWDDIFFDERDARILVQGSFQQLFLDPQLFLIVQFHQGTGSAASAMSAGRLDPMGALLQHLDQFPTPVSSLILQVAQDGLIGKTARYENGLSLPETDPFAVDPGFLYFQSDFILHLSADPVFFLS
jgi:hypothetical protein